jgi:hypothetical protein
MKQIILVALVLSILLVFAVGTAFAAPDDGDRSGLGNKSGLEGDAAVVSVESATVAAGGGITGASSGGSSYLDSRLYSFAEAIR